MAQNDSEKYINGAILQRGGLAHRANNMPSQYANRQKQYMAARTRQFSAERARYSTDYVQAKVQGIEHGDFYNWYETTVRLSDMHSTPSTAQQTDDTKIVLFDEPKIDYFPIGAKIATMGSTWICTNPSNLSSTLTSAVVRRCNASYNLYDFYGNIVTEPIVLDKVTMMANDNAEKPQNLVMMDGYFNVICQLNENTRQLGLNQRIILGQKAYFITGFNDFYQEFSGDYDSTHILYFTVRIEEPQENDDLDNRIANGKTFTFEAKIPEGQRHMSVGETLDLSAIFLKNGQDAVTLNVPYSNAFADNMVDEVSMEVNLQNGMLYATYPRPYKGTTFSIEGDHHNVLTETTAAKMRRAKFYLSDEATAPEDGELYVSLEPYVNYPISWIWTSSDPSIATVDEDGTVTAISEGSVEITATLEQNPAITAKITLVIGMVAEVPYIAFDGVIPQSIEQYDKADLSATYYDGVTPTGKPIEWAFGGADESSYVATIDGNTVEIYCVSSDTVPLIITATCEGQSVTTNIRLLGY